MLKRLLVLATLSLLVQACVSGPKPSVLGTVEESSPTQFGVGTRLTQELAGVGNASVNAVAGYQRQWFDGGHDNIFTVGIQGRRYLDPQGQDGTWLAAEGAYHNWRVSEDDVDMSNSVSNVFGLTGIVGHPLGAGAIHVWGSAGVLFFGDFEHDGYMVFEGGTGWQIQLGVEFQELFGGK